METRTEPGRAGSPSASDATDTLRCNRPMGSPGKPAESRSPQNAGDFYATRHL